MELRVFKKGFLIFSSLALVLIGKMYCYGGTNADDIRGSKPLLSKQITKKNKAKSSCGLVIPDSIEKNVPEDMQYPVFLQMILGLIRAEYVNELDEGEAVEKTIAGMLSSLDPHSAYLNEKAFSTLKNQTEGEFGGLGIEIMMDESFVRIISPIDDTPAYKAGLKSGDMIIYVDDECINGLTAEEVIGKLRGKPGTKVKLKIKRSDKPPFDVVIERDIIKVKSVKAEILNNVGYIRISTFDRHVADGIKKFVTESKNKKLFGLVIDVRNNAGGLLEEVVNVCDLFLDGGKIVYTKGRTEDNCVEFSAKNGDITGGLPIVVLINSGTASASEILAGALRDNKRALIVGTRSFGKGSVQKVIPLSEKTAIKLTVAKYFTPNGESIQANGITPDIEAADWVEIRKPDALFTVREEFFPNALDADKSRNKKASDEENKKAIDALGKKKGEKDKEEEDYELLYRKLSLKERVEKDFQLSKAFDTIIAIERMKNMAVKNAKK